MSRRPRYESKKEHGKVVPTWNHAIVHARGVVKIHEDADWPMSARFRMRMRKAGPSPGAATDAPESFIASQLKGIVGSRSRSLFSKASGR